MALAGALTCARRLRSRPRDSGQRQQQRAHGEDVHRQRRRQARQPDAIYKERPESPTLRPCPRGARDRRSAAGKGQRQSSPIREDRGSTLDHWGRQSPRKAIARDVVDQAPPLDGDEEERRAIVLILIERLESGMRFKSFAVQEVRINPLAPHQGQARPGRFRNRIQRLWIRIRRRQFRFWILRYDHSSGLLHIGHLPPFDHERYPAGNARICGTG